MISGFGGKSDRGVACRLVGKCVPVAHGHAAGDLGATSITTCIRGMKSTDTVAFGSEQIFGQDFLEQRLECSETRGYDSQSDLETAERTDVESSREDLDEVGLELLKPEDADDGAYAGHTAESKETNGHILRFAGHLKR